MLARLNRPGGLASVAAGFLWLLVWVHQRRTHGPTQENEERIFLGLTWLDSAKFLVVPLILLLIAMMSLYIHLERPALPGKAGFVVTIVGLGGLIVGTALEFWSFPWGSYTVGFDASLPTVGGIIQALSTLVFTVGLLVFNIDLVRAKVMPWWAAPVLVLGALTTFFLTPAIWLPGPAWILLGWVLWSRGDGAVERPVRVR